MNIFGRFLGRTDKYNPQNGETGIDAALWYQKPELVEQQRQIKYQQNWRHYYGVDINATRSAHKKAKSNEKAQTEAKINYTQVMINRLTSFAFGKRWIGKLVHEPIEVEDDNDEIEVPEAVKRLRFRLNAMLRFSDKVFHRENPGDYVRMLGALNCSVTGDAFLVAMPVLPESLEMELINGELEADLAQSSIRVMVVNSAFAFPKYSSDGQTLAEFTLEYPVELPGGGVGKFRQVITPSTITETTYSHDGEPVNSRAIANPIGVVYAVHIRNYPQPGVFGVDDINPIQGVVQELNDKISNVSDILDYHAAPTTLVFGARVSTLEKGANKIWSGLPVNARIENLKLEGDMAAMNTFIENLRNMIKEASGVSEAALGSDLAISNTSGVALHTRFYSMANIAEMKWASWGPGVKQLYEIILRWGRHLNQINFTAAQFREFRSALEFKFQSDLPKDELLEIQKNVEQVQGGLKSKIRAIADLGSDDPQAELAQINRENARNSPPTTRNGQRNNSSVDIGEEQDTQDGSTGRNISGIRAPTEASPTTTR